VSTTEGYTLMAKGQRKWDGRSRGKKKAIGEGAPIVFLSLRGDRPWGRELLQENSLPKGWGGETTVGKGRIEETDVALKGGKCLKIDGGGTPG